MKTILRLAVCWWFVSSLATAAAERMDDRAALPAGVRRVVWLGDSITYAGGYVTTVAAYFATLPDAASVEFINVGLASETVAGLSEEGHAQGKFPRPNLHERLARVLAQTKPDLVFACYGMNDGIYLPLADERFAKFKDGLRRLHAEVVAAGARVVHLTPPIYDDVRGGKAGYGAVLDRYSEWLGLQRQAAHWEVIDLHVPMRQFVAERRRNDPEFFLAGDGVHPNELGHWLMARAILRSLGARDLDDVTSVREMMARHPHGLEILALVAQRQGLMRDAWLTATGHLRPGVKAGLPLAQAQEQAAALDRKLAALR